MATLSNNDIAHAIYLVSKEKTHAELHEINNKVIKFLARRRLLSKTKDILERLDKIINHENKKIVVKVLSAKKLKEESKQELIFFLKKRYAVKEVTLVETIDEKLLGGVRIEVNDEIIDLTVKNKIKKLQEHLIRKI
jgi:F-type H+-transporting ATPase subunit delta